MQTAKTPGPTTKSTKCAGSIGTKRRKPSRTIATAIFSATCPTEPRLRRSPSALQVVRKWRGAECRHAHEHQPLRADHQPHRRVPGRDRRVHGTCRFADPTGAHCEGAGPMSPTTDVFAKS